MKLTRQGIRWMSGSPHLNSGVCHCSECDSFSECVVCKSEDSDLDKDGYCETCGDEHRFSGLYEGESSSYQG